MIAATLKSITAKQVREIVTHEVWQAGYNYFRHNAVLSINYNANNISAVVQKRGSRLYRTHIMETNSKITHMHCTCPYSTRWGWVCKHVVAVLLLWIQQRDQIYSKQKNSSSLRYTNTIINSLNPIYSIFSSWFSSLEPIKMHVDYLDSSHQLEIDLQTESNNRKAKLIVPAAESPELLKKIRLLPEIELSKKALSIKFNRSSVVHELIADYDEQGKLVLTPGYNIKNIDRKAGFISLEQASRYVIDGKWFWYRNTYTPIEEMQESIAPYFNGDKPLIYIGAEIINFLRRSMPALEHEKGFKPSAHITNTRILSQPTLKYIKVEDEGDWLYLAPYYKTAESHLSLKELITLRDNSGFIRHDDNWIYVPDDIIKKWSEIGELTNNRKIKVSRFMYTKFKAETGDDIEIKEPEPLRIFYTELNRLIEPTPAPRLQNMNGTLRYYQKTGYNWLWFLYKKGLNGILADEMGLGKTHQTMALLSAVYRNSGIPPSIIVAPTSVLDHWEDKLHTYLPRIKTNKYYNKFRSLEVGNPYEILLTTYTIMARDIKILSGREWEYVILDEAQKIKNYKTGAYKAAKALVARHKLALTGTPIENKLTELWSIFDFLIPGYLGSLDGFIKKYEIPITKYNDEEKKVLLKKIVHPFKLRRLKADVLKELPPKLEDVRYCSLTLHQWHMYKNISNTRGTELVKKLNDKTKSINYIHIFALITKLKRLCDHPALIIDDHSRNCNSGKFELFKELMEEALDSGQKIVVFSQYLGMLRLIQQWLTDKKIDFVSLQGSTRNRSDVIKRFQHEKKYRVFVGSLMAGGLGIDLTSASVVIHYDRWWNMAREDQATDRVHRIGQKKGVQVFKLITRGTLEERIDNLIKRKSSLLNGIIESDSALFKKLSRNELIELLRAPAEKQDFLLQ